MIVLNDQLVDYPKSVCWLEDPRGCPRTTDHNPRREWIRAIVVHTVHGKRGVLKPGSKSTGLNKSYAKYQANTPRAVSWDYTIDMDGGVAASNDPVETYTWHATSVNRYTLGIELIQETDGSQYSEGVEEAAKFIAFLCEQLGIQKQYPARDGKPISGIIPRIEGAASGSNVVGVYGHRNQTKNRGFGDPGDHIFHALARLGFEGLDFERDEDLPLWKKRQASLGLTPEECDGVPGPKTLLALKAGGYPSGMWLAGKQEVSASE